MPLVQLNQHYVIHSDSIAFIWFAPDYPFARIVLNVPEDHASLSGSAGAYEIELHGVEATAFKAWVERNSQSTKPNLPQSSRRYERS